MFARTCISVAFVKQNHSLGLAWAYASWQEHSSYGKVLFLRHFSPVPCWRPIHPLRHRTIPWRDTTGAFGGKKRAACVMQTRSALGSDFTKTPHFRKGLTNSAQNQRHLFAQFVGSSFPSSAWGGQHSGPPSTQSEGEQLPTSAPVWLVSHMFRYLAAELTKVTAAIFARLLRRHPHQFRPDQDVPWMAGAEHLRQSESISDPTGPTCRDSTSRKNDI